MNSNIITTQLNISKLRPNLFQLATGHVIGYGPRLAPDGLGFCFTCGGGDCSHVATVDEDWLAGGHSVEDDDGMIFASSAGLWPDDYGIQEPTL